MVVLGGGCFLMNEVPLQGALQELNVRICSALCRSFSPPPPIAPWGVLTQICSVVWRTTDVFGCVEDNRSVGLYAELGCVEEFFIPPMCEVPQGYLAHKKQTPPENLIRNSPSLVWRSF